MKLRISRYILGFSIFAFLAITFLTPVSATSISINGFEEDGKGCMPGTSIKDRPDRVQGEAKSYISEMNGIIGGYCWTDGVSGSIVKASWSFDWVVYICPGDSIVYYDSAKAPGCCPSGAPNYIERGGPYGSVAERLCSKNTTYVAGDPSNTNVIPVVYFNFPAGTKEPTPNAYISSGKPLYTCQRPKCEIDSSFKVIAGAGSYWESQITSSGRSCIAEGTNTNDTTCLDADGKSDQCVCFDTLAVSKKLFSLAKGNYSCLTLLKQCADQPSDQRASCTACMAQNCGASGTGRTWSTALGCIDTRLNPFVTRVIQIGLGVGSGIAILRIIQGAFMRQSGDPGKAQEGNEIIMSTIMAVAVLAGVLLIFRIIGVDVLGIFTEGQFQMILSS
jgi:hypothetical protein